MKITRCPWTFTGYAFEHEDGSCTCKTASPPDKELSVEELMRMDEERDENVQEVLESL